jgi:hypothetical protein
MRKSILFSLMAMIVLAMTACGGGDNANNSATTGGETGGETPSAADPYALYKKKGRNWTHKNTAGGTHMKTEVVELADDHAMIKMWTLDADKKPMEGMPEPEPTKIEFKKAEPVADTGGATPAEPKKETVKAAGKDWKCVSYDDGKTWMAEDMPGLVVKSEHQELVEFND